MKVTTRFDYPAVPVGEKFTVRLMIGVQGEVKDKRKYPINLALATALTNSGSNGYWLGNLQLINTILNFVAFPPYRVFAGAVRLRESPISHATM